jgi:steroid 5-alpha reductase family enzyme
MARLKVNYGRIDFAGRLMFAMIFALSPAILFYKVFGTKVGAVLIFFLAYVLSARLLVWTHERTRIKTADSARIRYEAGRIPVGKDIK